MAIDATYSSATTFTAVRDAVGNTDLRAQCAPGVRIRADCGADGYRYGVVTAVSYADPVTTIEIAGDALTSNLTAFEHGNDTPASLANHGHAGLADGGVVAHGALAGSGTNTHAQIDAHLGDNANPHDVTAAQVGLGSVTDDAQVKRSEMGAADGVASLDADGRVPQAQVGEHAAIHALDGRDTLASVLASMPAHFSRSAPLAAKTVTTAADRCTLGLSTSWQRLGCNIGESGFFATALADMVLSDSAVWDSTATDYTVAANRVGRDFYLYACMAGGVVPTLLLSANATYPAGYTAANSRKLGGFHCLCANVGTISGHTLSGYVASDILPASVWDQLHRPVCAPEGMVYSPGLGKWGDIYLASLSAGQLVSSYNGVTADGTSTPAFDWYAFADSFAAIGKRLPFQHELMRLGFGSPEGTNVAGSADPVTTGGHANTAGVRIISLIGCEDVYGVLWQHVVDTGGQYYAAGLVAQYNAAITTKLGIGYNVPTRCSVGGAWGGGTTCGSRSSNWAAGPLAQSNTVGARGVAEPLAVAA
jgi:hypothetical protein